MNAIADELETSIQTITPDLAPDEVAAIRVKLNAYLEQGKELKAKLDAAMIEYITTTGKQIVIGSVRYYVGEKREKVCRDQAECLQSLVEQFGPKHVGEQFLSSGAFKPGAVGKEIDPAEFDRLFEVVVKQKLEEGVAKKQLQAIDERFIR